MLERLIIEGPDGGGKTTLIRKLAWDFHYSVRPRAAHSTDGPVPQLRQWVIDETRLVTNPSRPVKNYLYDRHPLISEPIYGSIVRNQIKPWFDDETWVRRMSEINARGAVLIVCLPPLTAVRANLSTEPQMAGVAEHIEAIYDAYADLKWPGLMVRYDYETMSYSQLYTILRPIMRSFKNG